MTMELDMINGLYLELSQFATATTAREVNLEARVRHTNKRLSMATKLLRDVQPYLGAYIVQHPSHDADVVEKGVYAFLHDAEGF
jgi:hypothetical protein